MVESEIFGRLAAELSLKERKELLDKLNGYSTFSRGLLYEDPKNTVFAMSAKKYYHRLPWYIRLKFIIIGFFNGNPPKKVFENYQIARVGKIINGLALNLYDYRRNLLLPNFYEKLLQLKKEARFFYDTLNRSINQDKGAFYAFLASLEMEGIHLRIINGINPDQLAAHNPALPEGELRQMALNNLEQSLMFIKEDEKSRMYANVRSLNYLKALSTFFFDRIILSFTNHADGRFVCEGYLAADTLMALQDVLFSLKHAPPMALLESLFVFCIQEHPASPPSDIKTEIQTLLSMAESALMIIRDFNREVPLTLILRCIRRNMELVPKDIGGGEDWFVAYREYWKRQIDDQFNTYKRNCRYNELVSTIHRYFKRSNLKTLHYVLSPNNPDGFPLHDILALSFLITFYSDNVMSNIDQILRTILIEGKFDSPESQSRFSEVYTELIQFNDAILQFESRISPAGEYGMYYFSPRSESDPLQRRKVQRIIGEASLAAQGIIVNTKRAFTEMIKILEEFVRKDTDGKYTNIIVTGSQIPSKNTNFINGIVRSLQYFQQALQFLEAIDMLKDGEKTHEDAG
jgi:hypothetical protein